MFLGPNLRMHVREQLIAEVEGMPVDDAGFIVTGMFLCYFFILIRFPIFFLFFLIVHL